MKRHLQNPLLPIIIAPILLFAPMLFGGKALFWGTPSTQFVPWWEFAWDSIFAGKSPLWNPWLGMGAPLVANYQSAIFYPPNWIYPLLLGLGGLSWMAWGMTLLVLFHLIWAGIGSAKLLEDLGASKLGQVIGAMAFSLSGYLVSRAGFLSINAAAAWIPWLLYFSKRLIEEKSGFWKMTIVVAMQLLAGHAQTTWYAIMFTMAWAAFWALHRGAYLGFWKETILPLIHLAGAGFLAVGISAVQLMPTAEYLMLSQRASEFGYQTAMTYSFWPWRLLTLITPDLFGNPGKGNYWGYGNYWEDAVYIGLIPLCLAVGFMINLFIQARNRKNEIDNKNKIKRRLAIFLLFFMIISFILALGKNTFVFPFLYKNIPTFDLFQAPTRYTIWAVIALSLLAGLGVDIVKRPQGKLLYAARLIAAGCFAVSIGASLGQIYLPDVKTTFIEPFIRAGLLGLGFSLLILYAPEKRETSKHLIWSWIMIGLVSFDLVSVGWKLNPAIDRDFYRRTEEFEGQGRLYMPDDLEYDLKYGQFFNFKSFEPKIDWLYMQEYYLPNLNMLRRTEMVNNFDPILPERYQAWMRELSKIDLMDQPDLIEIMAVDGVISRDNKGDITLLNVSKTVDYVRLYDCIVSVENDVDSLALIFNDGIDLRDTLIVEDEPNTGVSCGKNDPGNFTIVSSDPGYLKVDVELRDDAWVFWSQEWYPGWVGFIDGENTMNKRADYLFQAIYCPAGKHTVEFIYKPASFLWGSVISGISLLVLLSGYIATRKKSHQEN